MKKEYQNSQLKNCPFCGSKAEFYIKNSYPDEWNGIMCSDCGIKTSASWDIEKEIERWNSRV